MRRRLSRFKRKWFLFGGAAVVPPPVPAETYYPKLDFTDYRNSMYSCGGF